MNKVYVEMIGASNNVLGTITLIDDLNIYQDWTYFRTEGFQLAPGTRRLKFVVKGQDACYWEASMVRATGTCRSRLRWKAAVPSLSTPSGSATSR